MRPILFDEAIPRALEILEAQYPGGRRPDVTLIRDAHGLLTLVFPDDPLRGDPPTEELAQLLHAALGPHSPGPRQVALRTSDLIDVSDVLESPDRVRLAEYHGTWLVDRQQTNQDWLRKPLVAKPPVPTAVAFSIKGGVGRTTAFALWAWALARRGKNVILVDLDLEAPGVAGLLLDEDHMPDYGLVDWLVEILTGTANEDLLRDCMTECPLSSNEPGQIRVMPALGKLTTEYVSKLGRIYMPAFEAERGTFSGLPERLLLLLNHLASLPDKPDLVLLDSRAGLHDIGAAAITRLGAEVFMFGRDDHQSWGAYRQLLRHLSRSNAVAAGMADDDLRWRLKMVGAQLPAHEAARRTFTDTSYTIWSETLYDEVEPPKQPTSAVEEQAALGFALDDENAPHYPLTIQFDSRVGTLSLTDPVKRPEWRVIETAFGDFFRGADQQVWPDGPAEGAD